MSRWMKLVFAVGLVGSVTAGCGDDNPFDAADTSTTLASEATTDESGTTAEPNVFLPEDANVTDCVGTLDRPNCGSKAKGGWRQYLTLAVLAVGLGFIGWRIAKGIRQRDAVMNDVGTG